MECAGAVALAAFRAWALLAIGACAGFLLLAVLKAGSDADDAQELVDAYRRGFDAGREAAA